MALLLWRRWLPDGVKHRIAAGIRNGSEDEAEKLLVFLAAAHDIGKATPAFATKSSGFRELDERIVDEMIEAGLPLGSTESLLHRTKTPHALATQILLHRAGCHETVAVVLGAHHGKPPDVDQLHLNYEAYPENYYFKRNDKAPWDSVQQELITYACKQSGFDSVNHLPQLDLPTQVLLSGLLVMVDWIASDTELFPYVSVDELEVPDSMQRAKVAWKKLAFTIPWQLTNLWMNASLYRSRFGISMPYPIQTQVEDVLRSIREPGIVVLEAPMGAGKTEAALVAAEIMAYLTQRRGIFFALPSQATSDGVFSRIIQWVNQMSIDEKHSIRLMHGKAQFNREFQNLGNGQSVDVDADEGAYVHEWFTGKKRSLLDDFVVGTIDQLLFAALKQKHVMLRHVGLANKVVVIDECHAFDAYMNCYLERALNWLGAYGVPVVVLSATLPAEKRKMVVDAYLGKRARISSSPITTNPLEEPSHVVQNRSRHPGESDDWVTNREYPLITYTERTQVRQVSAPSARHQKVVEVGYLDYESVSKRLELMLQGGGCVGVILNTVRRAQELARVLASKFGAETISLLHSRFLTPDRIAREERLLNELGKPNDYHVRPRQRIVVGTQVLEQSLDIDFDVLISEWCPMDLLLQRMGRLHRHDRTRPSALRRPRFFIVQETNDSFDDASVHIYSEYLLVRTRARLPQRIQLPHDIPHLVQDVYDSGSHFVSESEKYQSAEDQYRLLLEKKRQRAEVFRIEGPKTLPNLVGWLKTDVSDQRGEVAVRDAEDTLEVLLIQNVDGELRFLPWIDNVTILDRNREPPSDIAQQLARCSVRLPVAVSGRYRHLDETIRHLEQVNREWLGLWQRSPWLQGELFLVLDKDFSASLGKYQIRYHQDFGLEYTVQEDVSDVAK